ncbi:MAG TPA: VOC family protein [Hyphomicrobiaceae bacterium]|nr:VOC family protein [Hyphomicrobiaceae bacterium]
MSRPVHFEIHVDDPDRAIDFYQIVLGWSFERFGDADYWLIKTGDSNTSGINGGMLKRKRPLADATGRTPIIGFVCTMQVRDLETMLHAVTNAGGSIVKPRHAIPGIGWLAYARDTEGNIFGLTEPDPTAA